MRTFKKGLPKSKAAVWAVTVLLMACPGSALVAEDKKTIGIEYVGHACFVLESSAGTRIVIDPFNSHVWIGYEFPDPPPADAVLVTHPHYDHDASYYWPNDVPVFRQPGRYAVGDIRFEGLAGRHCDPYGKEFGQTNTIWAIELDGVRIVHLGDNGPISKDLAEAIGRVDVLMLPVDATFHILKREEVEEVLALLHPRLVVPMHYQLPELAETVQDLGPIDPWLEEREAVLRVPSHTTRLHPTGLPPAGSILVLRPSPSLRPWSEAYHAARRELAAARNAVSDEMVAHLRRAVELQPTSVRNAVILARTLADSDQEEAVRVLERALAGAGREDWAVTARARMALARLYLESGQTALAEQQARLVLAASQILELRQEANRILGRIPVFGPEGPS